MGACGVLGKVSEQAEMQYFQFQGRVEASVDDALDDVDIVVVSVIVIALKFVLPVPYSVNVSSGVDFELFMDDTSAGVTRAILTGFGIEALTDVNANAFEPVMTSLEFPVSSP